MDEWQSGDILAFHGTDVLSRAIKLKTSYPLDLWSCFDAPSHVGIVIWSEETNRYVLAESTTLCKHSCLFRKQLVSGAQAHLPQERIDDYRTRGGKVDHFRLVGINQLGGQELLKLQHYLIDYFVRRGVTYDYKGAAISGTLLATCRRWLPKADLESLFCSEMIAAVLMRIGMLNNDNPTFFSPGRLIKRLTKLGKIRKIRTIHKDHIRHHSSAKHPELVLNNAS